MLHTQCELLISYRSSVIHHWGEHAHSNYRQCLPSGIVCSFEPWIWGTLYLISSKTCCLGTNRPNRACWFLTIRYTHNQSYHIKFNYKAMEMEMGQVILPHLCPMLIGSGAEKKTFPPSGLELIWGFPIN